MMRPGNRCRRGGRRALLLTCRSVAPPLHFTASTSHPDAPDERVDSHLPAAGVGVTGTITARTRRGTESTMPTYDYECPKCGHEFETYQPITDDPLTKCPQKGCRGKIQRLIGGGAACCSRAQASISPTIAVTITRKRQRLTPPPPLQLAGKVSRVEISRVQATASRPQPPRNPTEQELCLRFLQRLAKT